MKPEPTITCPHGHELTLAEAATIRGKLNALSSSRTGAGKPRSCECGECPKCKRREKRKARIGAGRK